MRRQVSFVLLLLLAAGCSQPSAGSNKPSAPAASASAKAFPLPLLWLEDGTTQSGGQPRYFLTDWTGRRWATLSMWGQIQQSPDGSRALVDGANIIDTTGTGLGTVQIPSLPEFGAAWADDSRHVCEISVGQTGPDLGRSSLWLLALGATPTKLADLGRQGFDFVYPICSMATNRAVALGNVHVHIPPPQGNPYEATTLVLAVDLATDRTIYSRDYSPELPGTVLAFAVSADARLLAEQDQLHLKTTIKNLTTGQSVATFANAYVVGFSSDDRRVALHAVAGNVDETRVVDLLTGQVIWKGQGSLGVRFRPGSSDFLVRLDDPAGNYDLLLVPSAGSPRIIARQVFVTW
jgi:hypothetical protein